MNIAIIGANGFIGKHLTQLLTKDKNITLYLFGRSETNSTNIKRPYASIDLLNSEQILSSFKKIDLVYYLASDSIPSSSWNNAKNECEYNLIPFINFLECISKLKVRKIVFVSSAGTIYGSSNFKLSENADKKPFSPYGINKLTMEYYLNYFEVKHNLKHDIYRVSNIYGENQDTSKGLGIINTFIENILLQNKISVFGNGENVRNYIYVKDVVEILGYSAKSDYGSSNIFNLSSNDELSINELINTIKKIIQKDFTIDYFETRKSDNPFILLDNQKIKNHFPNIKFTPLQKGIANTISHIKKNATT